MVVTDLTLDEVKDLPVDMLSLSVGIITDIIIQPPRCKRCGNYLYIIKLDSLYGQCSECGSYHKLEVLDDIKYK